MQGSYIVGPLNSRLESNKGDEIVGGLKGVGGGVEFYYFFFNILEPRVE